MPNETESADIEQSHMDIAQQAMSEAQEAAMRALSPEQLNMLESSKLEIHQPFPDNTIVTGDVVIEGRNVSLEVVKYQTAKPEGDHYIQEDAYFARIDGRSIDDQAEAKQLFDFYHPMAQTVAQNKYYPTNESDRIYQKKLIDKLVGK